MSKGNSTIFALVGVAVLIVSAAIAYTTANNVVKNVNVGGLVNISQRDFPDGISVDGTERISGSGGGSFTTGSFSSTLAITGASTLTGGVTVGSSGTAISKILCISTTTDWAAFTGSNCQWGTTTMTGLTTGSGWDLFVSPIATTSGIETVNHGFNITAYATATNAVALKICNASTTNANLPTQYYEVCAMRH